MPSPSEPRSPDPAWLVSIHDKDQRRAHRFLAFDLKDILEALGPQITGYWWLLVDLNCTGERVGNLMQAVDAKRGAGVIFTGEELVGIAESIFQTIDATIFAVPLELSGIGEEAKSARRQDATRRLTRAEVDFANAPLAIEAIDSSFWQVFTRNEQDVQRLRARFRDVREEDPSEYVKSSSDNPPRLLLQED